MGNEGNFSFRRAFTTAAVVGALGVAGVVHYFRGDVREIKGAPVVRVVEGGVGEAPDLGVRFKNSLEKIASSSVPKKNEVTAISYKTDRDDFSDDSDVVLLARMLYGEGRDRSDAEKVAIAYSAINRINDGKKWNGVDIRSVVLARKQYSCFNRNDTNRKKLMDPENKNYSPREWGKCLKISQDVLGGKLADPTGGATHYHTGENPYWAKPHSRTKKGGPKMERIGRVNGSKHIFYRED